MAIVGMIPSDGSVVIDGIAAFGVDFTGIDPSIHAVQWNGVEGFVEPVYDPFSGIKPPNVPITSFAPFQTYYNQAQAIIYAQQNPAYYYSTIDDNYYQGVVYDIGAQIVIFTPNPVQPPYTTITPPPSVDLEYQTLQWTGSTWVVASFTYTESLSQAQSQLISLVQESGAQAVDNEARIYSVIQLLGSASPEDLPTADYLGLTLGGYQTYIDGEVTSKTNEINAATSPADLYDFNPNINPVP